jgi:hypothetical protein
MIWRLVHSCRPKHRMLPIKRSPVSNGAPRQQNIAAPVEATPGATDDPTRVATTARHAPDMSAPTIVRRVLGTRARTTARDRSIARGLSITADTEVAGVGISSPRRSIARPC